MNRQENNHSPGQEPGQQNVNTDNGLKNELFHQNANSGLTMLPGVVFYDCSIAEQRAALSEETKVKISNSMKGHKVAMSTRIKISKALTGRSRPSEVGKKISATKQEKKNEARQKTDKD